MRLPVHVFGPDHAIDAIDLVDADGQWVANFNPHHFRLGTTRHTLSLAAARLAESALNHTMEKQS